MQTVAEPRVEIIEGQKVLVFDEPSVLPSSLGALLTQMRITYRDDNYRVGGMSSLCAMREHRLHPFRAGRHLGSDGVIRDLRLLICTDCETVCVRDVSVDTLGDARRQSRLAPRRRDEILGWYTGARRNQREYR